MFFSGLSVSLLSLLVILCNAQTEIANSTFQVGVILDLDSLVGRIGLSSLSLALSDFYSINKNYTTKLVLHVRDSRGQVIDAAAAALSLLQDVEVDAIIGPQRSAEASFVVGLGDRANVPIISFSASSPALLSPNSYFVRAALSDSYQVDAIAAIVKYFQWSQVVIVHEDSDYGHGIIPYLVVVLNEQVFPKASPLVADVSREVIELTENDRISEIEREWMKDSDCNGPDATVASTTISLQSFKTLFGITSGITAACLIVFLVKYLIQTFVLTILG